MSKNNSLKERARKKLTSLDIVTLRKKPALQSQFQYEIFNQYPPLSLLDALSGEVIFNNHGRKRHRVPRRPLALYVHLPFCKRKCPFCCYFSISDWDTATLDTYIHCVRKEAQLLSKKAAADRRIVTSLYWGGGTPSLLDAKQINILMLILRDNFSIAPDAELTFEATPESITAGKLSCFRKNGFNRLNIGVQSFDDALLRPMGRLYTAKEAFEASKKKVAEII